MPARTRPGEAPSVSNTYEATRNTSKPTYRLNRSPARNDRFTPMDNSMYTGRKTATGSSSSPSRRPCEMPYHITANSTMEETNSITVLKRSATSVMPIGASQPPICTVWRPWTSTVMIMVAAIAASANRVPRAMVRCSCSGRTTKISAAATAGSRIGMAVR